MNIIKLKLGEKYIKYRSEYISDYKYYGFNSTQKLISELHRTCDSRTLYYEVARGSYNGEGSFIETTPGEIYDVLHTNIFPSKTAQIQPKSKIFFSDSTFPSLLLGRLGLDLKRTTKADNADVIVSDCNFTASDCFQCFFLFDLSKKIFLNISIKHGETKQNFENKVNNIIQVMNTNFKTDLKLYSQVSKEKFDMYDAYNQHSSKFIKTSDFEKYIISQLPVLQQQECDNICYMLKSQDSQTISTALGTLQYYNFFDCGVDILGALISTKCYSLPDNREAEYIYSLLGTSKGNLTDARSYRVRRQIQFFMNTMNKFIISPSMSVKQKVLNVLRQNLFDQISEDYKDELERLDVTLNLNPNDKNGEADASSSKVEGEKV